MIPFFFCASTASCHTWRKAPTLFPDSVLGASGLSFLRLREKTKNTEATASVEKYIENFTAVFPFGMNTALKRSTTESPPTSKAFSITVRKNPFFNSSPPLFLRKKAFAISPILEGRTMFRVFPARICVADSQRLILHTSPTIICHLFALTRTCGRKKKRERTKKIEFMFLILSTNLSKSILRNIMTRIVRLTRIPISFFIIQ